MSRQLRLGEPAEGRLAVARIASEGGESKGNRSEECNSKVGITDGFFRASTHAYGQGKIRSFEAARERGDDWTHRPRQDDADRSADQGGGRQGLGEVRAV